MRKFYLFMLALIAFTLNVSAGVRVLYQQHFEGATDAASAGWTSPNVSGGFTIGSDQFGKYLLFNSGTNNDRSAHTLWGADIFSGVSANEYTVSFQFSPKQFGNNHTTTELTVMSDETTCTKKANYNFVGVEGSQWLFDLTQQSTTGAAATGDQPFAINNDVSKTIMLTAGTYYNIQLNVNVADRTVAYSLSPLTNPDDITSGTYTVPEGTSMYATGIYYLAGRYQNQGVFDNITVSALIDEDVANVPTVSLSNVNNQQRVYSISFLEDETLHYKFADGEEEEVSYMDTEEGVYTWSNNPNYNPENEELVKDACNAGTLEVWTTCGDAESEHVTTEVENTIVAVPTATTTIVNVSEGFGKTFTLNVDNSTVPLQPKLFLAYEFKNEAGEVVDSKSGLSSGDQVEVPSKGTLKITTSAFGYGTASTTKANDVEYTRTGEYNFAHWTVDDITKAGFSEDGECSHRFATYGRFYWYDSASYDATAEDNSAARQLYNTFTQYTKAASAWEDGKISGDLYFTTTPAVNVYIFQGVGLVLNGQKGDAGDGNWINSMNLKVDNLTSNDFVVVSGYSNYGSDALHPVCASQDEFLAADNGAAKGVYPGDTEFSLYRYSDCISRIQVFKPVGGSTGIKGVNTVETAAPAVKKVVTKNGVVIVKGDKVFSVAGAQMK